MFPPGVKSIKYVERASSTLTLVNRPIGYWSTGQKKKSLRLADLPITQWPIACRLAAA
jgi:hypothetical protein